MRGPEYSLVLVGVAFAFLAQSAAPARAAWPHDPAVNVPLCTETGNQESPVIVPDGAGGAIVAWRDFRNGSHYDIYVQRVNAVGTPQWTANGLALCVATGQQSSPSIASDGAGGAIVAWQDQRSGNWDIYAQRVSAAGTPQWTANGVALCAATGDQQGPAIVSDGAGGAIVAWQDGRGANLDLYAQRVNAVGAAQWAANGVAFCTATGSQTAPKIVADGLGGAIVTGQDGRGGNGDVYAQRLNASGVRQWTANGVGVCAEASIQQYPMITSDNASGAIVTWQDARGTNTGIYAQRVAAAGAAQWTANGVALCTATGDQQIPTIAADGSGGAIVTWRDYRSGTNSHIYAQRVNSAGTRQWAATGRAVCVASGDQYVPTIVPDGASGAIVAWYDSRNGANTDVYAQRLNGAGVAQWPTDGAALCASAGDQRYPTIASDGSGGAIVTWQDYRVGSTSDVYAQRIEWFGYLGNPEPVIVSVRDVANDQGGKVKVSWEASWLDMTGDEDLAAYNVMRSLPAGFLAARLARGARVVSLGEDAAGFRPGDILTQPTATGDYYWEQIATVTPVHYLTGYSYLAATAGDSIAGSNPYTAFMVVARNASYTKYWSSRPDSGYSVDNLAPTAPSPLTGEYASGTAALHWLPNGEADLQGYRLYRGATADFVPGPGNRIAEPADTGYVDAAGSLQHYKLSAVDVHGNESGYAALWPGGPLDVPAPAPPPLALSLASANPARGGATLRWALPAAGEARLVVYDVTGRIVRELASGHAGAGVRTTSWDGRDGAGGPAPAGMYVARLETPGHRRSVRFVLVR